MCRPAIRTACPVPCRAPAVRGPVARDSLHNSAAKLPGRPAGSVPPWGLLSDELIGPIGHSGAVYGSLRAWTGLSTGSAQGWKATSAAAPTGKASYWLGVTLT